MLNLTDFQRRMIILGIALILILFGVVQGLFKFEVNRKIVDNVSYVLMLVAFMLLFSGKKKPEAEQEEKPQDEKIDS